VRPQTLPEALAFGHGIERPFLCPVHGDSRPSASVNTLKKVWTCYTCGAHGGITGENALIEPDYQSVKRWFTQKMEEQRVYPEAWLSRWDAGPVHPYWLERVGERAARAHRLGYDPESEACTYPLRRSDGAVLGVVRRPLEQGDGPKYPFGVDVGRLLYGYTPEHRSYVVLTEGALDAIALWRVGVPAFAIYGAVLHPYQVALIDKIDPSRIYTCYDKDAAGWKAHCATERAFKHRLVTRLTWPESWGKDIDAVGQENRKKIVSRLVSSKMVCIESETCTSSPQQTPNSASTSPRRRLWIKPMSA
jgi:DNA primase